MADVTGPISSLPGSRHSVPAGTKCDMCSAPAVIRIQGETDSMGSEMGDYCLACSARARDNKVSGECDWCHGQAELTPTRDPDEGMCGPVYYVCQACLEKQRAQQLAEYNEMVKEDEARENFYDGDDEPFEEED